MNYTKKDKDEALEQRPEVCEVWENNRGALFIICNDGAEPTPYRVEHEKGGFVAREWYTAKSLDECRDAITKGVLDTPFLTAAARNYPIHESH
jgi:hypothetical protein